MLNLGRLGFFKKHKGKVRKTVIKIPSGVEYIRKVSFKILAGLGPYKLDADTRFDIRLCVEEAVRNAMVHGNRGEKKLPVRVAYWVKDGKLTIEVEDRGAGFDRSKVADPTTEENIMRGSGRGVYLIKKMMDEVEYTEAGSKMRMTKYLN